MAYYRCGPTAIGSRASWAVTSPDPKNYERPLSGNFDRIFNAFERTNAFEYVRNTFEEGEKARGVGHADVVVNRKMSSSFERADCALAAQTPCSEDEDFYREKILYSQARQLFPLQEDLADWINKTIGTTYITGENFLDALDNGAELCQLAGIIHERAREALDQGLIVGPVPQVRGRCWQRAARRSFFSRDNTENFLTFCRDLGVHENLLFESDDLVLHNQPRQVILCLLEVARLATRYSVEPPGLVQLEKEIAQEERDSGLDSAMSGAWQFRDLTPPPDKEDTNCSEAIKSQSDQIQETPQTELLPSPEPNDSQLLPDNTDAESTKSEGTVDSTDSDVPLKPTNELDKRVQLMGRLMARGCSCGAGRCSRLLKVRKVGEGRYNIAGRNVFIRLLKGRHMMVRVGGGWDTLEHFLSRHEPCQVRLVAPARRDLPATNIAANAATPPRDDLDSKLARKSLSPASSKTSITSKDLDQKLSSTPRKQSISPASSRNSIASKDLDPKLSPIRKSISPASSKTSVASKDRASGTTSPVDSKASSISGKSSPTEKRSNKTKVEPVEIRRTSTPIKTRTLKSSLTLPLKADSPQNRCNPNQRARKQSAPSSFSTPNTPTGRSNRTPPGEFRKSLTSSTLTNAPKKSRSMSLGVAKEEKKYCGTDKLNSKKTVNSNNTSATIASRKTRSQSLASTPVNEPKKPLITNGFPKKTRSMSLATPADYGRPLIKSVSLSTNGPLTQAAIEESIRQSLAASIVDTNCPKKPFLHIKAKYRSPPPREVPPR